MTDSALGDSIRGENDAMLAVGRRADGLVDVLAYTLGPPISGQAVTLTMAAAARFLDVLALELGLGEDATAQLRLAAEEREGEPCRRV